ncbi:MAG TPA: hypothetical protein DCE42_28285, partial [Myxococcales bacterium]|nr:hypothetical protein [Myxococcales bacterium]
MKKRLKCLFDVVDRISCVCVILMTISFAHAEVSTTHQSKAHHRVTSRPTSTKKMHRGALKKRVSSSKSGAKRKHRAASQAHKKPRKWWAPSTPSWRVGVGVAVLLDQREGALDDVRFDGEGELWSSSYLSEERLRLLRMLSIGEWVSEWAGGFFQQVHPSDTSPMIRGGGGSRIALRLDGVPYLSGWDGPYGLSHLRAFPGQTLRSVEVFRGPVSSLFGEHGLAGALSLKTRGPVFAKKGAFISKGEIAGGYESADQAPSGYAWLSFAGPDIGVVLSGGARLAQNVRIGGEDGLALSESGYQTLHASAKLHWRIARDVHVRALYQYTQLLDVRRNDLYLTQAELMQFARRHHFSYLKLSFGLPALRTQARLLFSYQRREEEEDIRHLAPGTRALQGQHHIVYPGQIAHVSLHLETKPWSFLRLVYGVEGKGEWWGAETLLSQGEDRYVPSAFWQDAERKIGAAFLRGHARLLNGKNKVFIEAATRVQGHFGEIQVERQRQSWAHWEPSSMIGFRVHMRDLGELRLMYAYGMRSPSLRERSGGRQRGLMYILPQPELQAENSRSLELQLRFFRWKNLRLSARVYLQQWQQLISLVSSTREGSETFEGRDVMQYENISEANMFGTEATLWWNVWMGWSIKFDVAWQHVLDATLPKTPAFWPTGPPLLFGATTRYSFGELAGIEVRVQFADAMVAQVMPSSLSARSKALANVASWVTISLRGDVVLVKHLHIIASIDNVLGERYRRYASYVPSPGQNARLL